MENMFCTNNSIPHIEIDKRTQEYLSLNYGEEVKYWIDNIDEIVDSFIKKWNLTYVGQEPKSRFGCILYVEYNNDEYVLKLIPPCCERLYSEVKCYHELPYSNMLELVDSDIELGGFLIKRISNKKLDKLEYIQTLFRTMYMQRKKVNDSINGFFVYADSFMESLARARKIIENSSDKEYKSLLVYIERAKECFSVNLEKKDCYLLHGDAHIHNILFDGETISLIDPIGYIGPFEIEYARFWGTYIRENDVTQDNIDSIIKYMEVNGNLSPSVIYALGVDVTMRTCNTFFEGDSYEEIKDAIMWCKRVWDLVDVLL